MVYEPGPGTSSRAFLCRDGTVDQQLPRKLRPSCQWECCCQPARWLSNLSVKAALPGTAVKVRRRLERSIGVKDVRGRLVSALHPRGGMRSYTAAYDISVWSRNSPATKTTYLSSRYTWAQSAPETGLGCAELKIAQLGNSELGKCRRCVRARRILSRPWRLTRSNSCPALGDNNTFACQRHAAQLTNPVLDVTMACVGSEIRSRRHV